VAFLLFNMLPKIYAQFVKCHIGKCLKSPIPPFAGVKYQSGNCADLAQKNPGIRINSERGSPA
jgi:hypothetical protein